MRSVCVFVNNWNKNNNDWFAVWWSVATPRRRRDPTHVPSSFGPALGCGQEQHAAASSKEDNAPNGSFQHDNDDENEVDETWYVSGGHAPLVVPENATQERHLFQLENSHNDNEEVQHNVGS